MESLKETKLINILSVITRAEWRLFRVFLESGIGGPVGKSLSLFDFLADFHPAFSSGLLSRTHLFSAVFPKEDYEDKKLRYAMTDLYRQACSFLSFRAIQEDPSASTILLQELLAKRGADKAYLSVFQLDAKEARSDAAHNADFYFNRYRETFAHLNFYLPRQQRSVQHPIGEAARYLDIFYIAKKLQLLCEIINVRNVMSVNYDFFLQDEIIGQLKGGAFAEVPVIGIYYRILMTLTSPGDVQHFTELRMLLRDKTEGFERPELRDMYQYLMNYCIRQINLGNVGFVTTLFEIYQLVLERKIIYNGSSLSQWDFKNIVAIGIRAGKHEWVHDFIETVKDDLATGERENAYTYNISYYYFGTGNFRKAIALLQQVEFTDLYYQLDTRAILLKCYYELDDQETLMYHLAAFRAFLSRNKLISDYQRATYRNLIKFTTHLVRNSTNSKKIELLSKEMEEVKQVADIGWLRRMIKEKTI